MLDELTFSANSPFEDVTFDGRADSWYFLFGDNISASASGFWRLIGQNEILFVSLDHGHQFGLPKPVDLVEELKRKLLGKRLIEIHVAKHTADLTLTFTEDCKLEIYIASAGYET